MESAAPPLLNRRYRLGPLVGEGAMATVSRATDVVLDRTVAVKMLKPALATDATVVRRFSAEARAAARLVDPHVVAVFDVLSDGAAHAIVMEYVDGPTLATLLTRDGPLAEAQTIVYARDIARALSAAHANGIVHRDIKPANVLIAPGNVAKVADFGLARAIDAGDGELTERGRLVGSVHYLSPEQAQGLALSPASDLYSVGIVIYQAMTGTVPFASATPLASAVAHITEPPPSEAALARTMSPGLASIVHRLLQKDPALRFASAGELDDALAALERAPATAAWDEPTVVGTIPVVSPASSARSMPANAAWTSLLGALAAIAATTRATSAAAANGMREGLASSTRGLASSTRGLASNPRAFDDAVRAMSRPHRTGSFAIPAVVAGGAVVLALAATLGAKSHVPPAQGAAAHRAATAVAAAVTVPDVRGMDLARAGAAMQRAGLTPSFAARVTNVPANTVVGQFPAAGTQVKRRAGALVIVSAGPRPRVIYSDSSGDANGWIPPGHRKHHGGGNDEGD